MSCCQTQQAVQEFSHPKRLALQTQARRAGAAAIVGALSDCAGETAPVPAKHAQQ